MANDMKPISYIKKLGKNFDATSNSINKIKNLKNNWTEQNNINLNNIDSGLGDKVAKADLDAYSAYLDSLRQIKVNTPADGETVTATKGDTVLTQNSVNKQCIFDIPSYGDWTIKKGSDELVVSVNELKQYIPKFGFSDYTWQEINDISEAGQAASKFHIGDEKDIQVGSETLTFQIYDFNHDDLADGSGKAGITLGMKNLMATRRVIESNTSNANSFIGSEMYKWLNGECFYNLPGELKPLIKSVNKKTSAGNQSTSIRTDAMRLWLFSENEVGLNQYSVSGEGTKYPIFTDNNSRIKTLSNPANSGSWWWLRSPYANRSGEFCYVNEDGAADYHWTSGRESVCFGFCI